MTTTKKLAIAVVSLSLALVCVIGGTLAYLVATSDTVTNTFTYGNIKITLTETKGTEKEGNVREFGAVVPGAEVEKDPTVTVVGGSEKCYVYAKVENNVVLNGSTVVTCNIDTANWTVVEEKKNDNGSVVTLYRYKEAVAKADGDTKLPALFENVKFSTDIKSGDVAALDAITNDIVITAYAHQYDNIDNIGVADAAAIAWANE